MMTYYYKWPHSNLCGSFIKPKERLQDSLCHGKWIYVGFKLNKPTFQELWPPLDGLCKRNWEKLLL